MVIDLKNATLTIADGNSHTLTVRLCEGVLSWTEKKNIEYIRNRGSLNDVKEGDQVPLELKLDAIFDFITMGSDNVVSFNDALTKTGGASAWTSSDTDTCQPYAVNLILVHTPVCTAKAETVTFPKFRYESLDFDPKTGKISCSGKCNVTKVSTARAS